MAQFRGTIVGQRGEASRLGTKKSGLTVDAAGWGGKIVVELYHDESTGDDKFHIIQDKHQGAGIYEPIASGVLGKTVNEQKKEKADG